MLKYRKDVELELRRTENLLERAKSANNIRDKVSRAYYACYHSMIAAIWMKKNLNEASIGTAHELVLREYVSIYTRTKGNNISQERDINKVIKSWKRLRASADYDIFTKDFDKDLYEKTCDTLAAMYRFVDAHIAFIVKQLESDSNISKCNL